MNLLVTNTRHAQAYTIIQSLRPYAQKVVATTYGRSALVARCSHAANSRLVDRRYRVPSPVEDWRAGNIQRENTEREEAYIQAVLRICEKEQIDTIFPSHDPHVYVFAKNKERFERLGVLLPVPDYDVVITPLDKYQTYRTAVEAGFPCPRTYLVQSDDDLRRPKDELGFPMIVRPRFTSGGAGMAMVYDDADLCPQIRRVASRHGKPMVQEYIPGSRIDSQTSYRLLLDRKGAIQACFSTKILRVLLRFGGEAAVIHELVPPGPQLGAAAAMLQRLQWWGAATVSTKIDPRDGIAKLTEVNCRLGSRLWHGAALGINVPLMCLAVARDEPVEPVTDYAYGTLLVEPVEDFMELGFWLFDRCLYSIRTDIMGQRPFDPLRPPMTFTAVLQSLKETYWNECPRLFSPVFRCFLADPVPAILWWTTMAARIARHYRFLGR